MNWKEIKVQQPEFGVEVICFNPAWINEDFNPNGTRIGFLNGEGVFTTAHWWDYQDCYMTISKSDCEGEEFSDEIKNSTEPTHWIPLPDTSILNTPNVVTTNTK